MKSFHITFKQSGTDAQGKAIKDDSSYGMTFRAQTQANAEKRLRSLFFKSVKIEVVAVSVSEVK